MKKIVLILTSLVLSACTMTIPISGEPTQSVQRTESDSEKIESLNTTKVKAAETAKVKQEEKEKKSESQPTQDDGRGGGNIE